MQKHQDLHSFFLSFRAKNVKKGIVLLDQFSHPPGLYYLTKGCVRQYCISEEGKELTLHIYTPHAFFPLSWVFESNENRFSFQTLTDTTYYIIPKERFLSFVSKHPDLYPFILKNILQGMNGLTKRIELDAFYNARMKVLSILSYVIEHFGEPKGKTIHITQHFTHERIASLSGLTREHVSLELEQLESEHVISLQNHEIVILDSDAFAKLFHFRNRCY